MGILFMWDDTMEKKICEKCGKRAPNYYVFLKGEGPFCETCVQVILYEKNKSGVTLSPDPKYTT